MKRMVEVLLHAEGINVAQSLAIGATPFYVACQNGHIDVVRILAADPRVDVTQGMQSGATPLYVACQNGHLEVRHCRVATALIHTTHPSHPPLPCSVSTPPGRQVPCERPTH